MTAGLEGTTLGRYEILEELGQGGMSVVYRAEDTSLHRDVAIKVMHAFLAEQTEARERFHREAVAVARLRHPHIIEIYDYSGEDAATSFIVTELVRGMPLSKLLERTTLAPPEAAVLLARPIAEALHHAHVSGVVHRDLKPENILVGEDGSLKLTDFGIARMLDSTTLTTTGTLLGSPAYMAPEYIEGYASDERADVFSFGTMLYRLATGKLPFEATSPHALLKKIAGCECLAPDRANPAIHGAIARLIARCMARLPEDRYSSMSEVLAQIDAILAKAGVEPEEDLKRLLADPKAYGAELCAALAPRYLQSGKTLLKNGATGAAIEDFDRVLGLDPHNGEVRKILDRLARRAWAVRAVRAAGLGMAGALFVSILGSSLGSWWGDRQARLAASAARPATDSLPQSSTPAPLLAPSQPEMRNVPFTLEGTGDLYVDGVLVKRGVTGLLSHELAPGGHAVRFASKELTDAHQVKVPEHGPIAAIPLSVAPPAAVPEPPPPLPTREITFRPSGLWVTLYVDGDTNPAAREMMRTFTVPLTDGMHKLRFVNDRALPYEMEINVGENKLKHYDIELEPVPAKLRVVNVPDGYLVVVEGGARPRLINEDSRDVPINVPLDPLPPGAGSKILLVTVKDPKGNTVQSRLLTFRPTEEQTFDFSVQ